MRFLKLVSYVDIIDNVDVKSYAERLWSWLIVWLPRGVLTIVRASAESRDRYDSLTEVFHDNGDTASSSAKPFCWFPLSNLSFSGVFSCSSVASGIVGQ